MEEDSNQNIKDEENDKDIEQEQHIDDITSVITSQAESLKL